MADFLCQSVDSFNCDGYSALVYYGKHYIMAGKFLGRTYHSINLGGDARGNKLFYSFMVAWDSS